MYIHTCTYMTNIPWMNVPYISQGSVTYQVPSGGLTWSSVFNQLETNKERLGIVDYSVSQTTLDQVSCSYLQPL